MKEYPKELRPVCPKCGETLKLVKITCEFESFIQWECSCTQIMDFDSPIDVEYYASQEDI